MAAGRPTERGVDRTGHGRVLAHFFFGFFTSSDGAATEAYTAPPPSSPFLHFFASIIPSRTYKRNGQLNLVFIEDKAPLRSREWRWEDDSTTFFNEHTIDVQAECSPTSA